MKNLKTVYLHQNKVTLKTIYVGCGSEKRPYDMWGRSAEHKNVIKTDGVEVKIVAKDMPVKAASMLEKQLIKSYGLKNLLNKSINATGFAGHSKSQQAKDAISASRAEKKRLDPNYGRSEKTEAYAASMRLLTDNQIEAIIEEINTTLPLGTTTALELDAEIGLKYGVAASTIWDLRSRKHRYAKYPQTLTRSKIKGGWAFRLLQEGETPLTHNPKVKSKGKRSMRRITK
tara:strand:+ start:395 stop:1084 length:690 start_codon:yes stop_codon:yes gene_type:complete